MRTLIRAAVAALALTAAIATAGAAHAQPGSADGTPRLDARAAAAATGKIGINSTWYTGTVNAGGSQTWVWYNAPADVAYVVGYTPSGASTSAACQFQTTDSRYLQVWGGERRFQFTLQNTGSIACAATVLLSGLSSWTINSTGGVAPGGTQTHLWTNLPAGLTYVAGFKPTGSTSSAACQWQVVRSWYVQSGAARQFWFTIKNVGAVTCQADIQLATVSGGSTVSTGTLAPGASVGWLWYSNIGNYTHAIGLASSTSGCQLETTRLDYRQIIESNGSASRQILFYVKNVGSTTCSGSIYLPVIAA
ncbi:hypothetical protein Cs7R123_49780 [Catellatospora sp. TT07R-123]|uniref:hypothetical protein n=1 Tax=Catellatospora sp. TT07R-123 TaxID=2733863 RepID=UPI001B151301|nr:hypothetical protein [Catellatospora sp. TT07R-123]GHJ47636.1 hypothetical protein Cs7R123_49780 [Catellatospora sp. TT07R-123]